MKARRTISNHKRGILAFIGLVAIAWIKLGSVDKLATTGTHEMECSALSHCAAVTETRFLPCFAAK